MTPSAYRTRVLVRRLLVAMSFAIASAALATSYQYGRVWDYWEIVSGPANTGFEIQIRNNYGTWRTVDSGTTDSVGDAWGIVGPNLGPTTEGKFQVGHDDCVRIKWANGQTWKLKTFGLPAYYSAQVNAFTLGQGMITAPQTFELRQNAPDSIAHTGMAGWWEDGSTLRMTLPPHLTFAGVPTVTAIDPVGLTLGAAALEDAGASLVVPILSNARVNPADGVRIESVQLVYDGAGVADEYVAAVQWSIVLTPAGAPFSPLEAGAGFDFVRVATVTPDPAIEWFDETNGGAGFTLFDEHRVAFVTWRYEPVVEQEKTTFEILAVGEKLTSQYADRGVFFSGTDGGQFNQLTGVQLEGDPLTVESLTGYDGSYQPPGSHVYVRFQNTADNPDAPFTMEFHPPRSMVAAFLATGVQGADHSFTIVVRDADGRQLAQKVVEAELWEADPTGQNYETFFGVRSAIPNISTLTITNNATVPFADALIIDTIEFARTVTTLAADADRDGDVDLVDYGQFDDCLAGPGPNLTDPACLRYDSDTDGDVDVVDFAAFQAAFQP